MISPISVASSSYRSMDGAQGDGIFSCATDQDSCRVTTVGSMEHALQGCGDPHSLGRARAELPHVPPPPGLEDAGSQLRHDH
eukprot:9141814-Pyramimonas_sp.AAC.1